MSMAKDPQQLSIWNGLTENQKAKALHKTRSGKGRQIRIKQKCVTLNQALIVKMRKDLRPTTEIAAHLNLDCNTIRNFLVKAFGDKDPLDLHVLDSYDAGESAKAIGKRLQINKQVICGILKKHGLDPWKNYLERESQSFRETGVPALRKRPVKNPDRPRMIAEDLYCFWLEMENIEEVSIETGYSAASISWKFISHIPGYKEASALRRKTSKVMQMQRRKQISSSQFRFEKQFSDHCVNILHEHKVQVGLCFGLLETDLVVEANGRTVIIELKVTTKLKEMARALGQLLMQKGEFNMADVGLVLCVPDDVDIHEDLKRLFVSSGVEICSSSDLREIVCGLLA